MDKALKQRLVGASVLIALAVIVLPMLLGGRPEGAATEPEKIELPSQPSELNFETRRYPIGDTAESGSDTGSGNGGDRKTPPLPSPRIPATTGAEPSGETAPPAADGGPTITGLGPAPVEEAGDESTPSGTAEDADSLASPVATTAPATPLESKSMPTVGGRYVVQVASFGAANNANRLSGQLKDSGYSVMTDTVKSDVGTLHRVRVGPYDSEALAREAVVALSASIQGVKPRIMDLQPDQATQVTTPDDPLVRWIVQVGSFSSSANAENVVASLRLKGMSAYQETLTSSGSEIFRVRVGPFLSRDAAVTAEREINESLPVKAVVMTTD
jgi:cell division septation protein DedD